MSWKSVDHFVLDVEDVFVPDEGLGDFKCCFTNEHKPFNWFNLLWLLIPVVGIMAFIF